jgi:PiT family inorganic phosphate transporter
MDGKLLIVIVLVLLALSFDFINGFHDAANSIATIVSTRVLSPKTAVAAAAVSNFAAFFVFPLHVADTIGKGIIDPGIVDLAVVTGALVGAILWNLMTWWWGLPSSSSHALVGGLIGSGVAKGGFSALGIAKILQTAAFIVVSPVIGLVVSGALTVTSAWLLRRRTPGKVDHWFRRLQLVSASAFSLSHGGNDAQKTMGIIAVLLFSQGYLGKSFPKGHAMPIWIVFCCYAAMGLGTLSGGWRIVRTMGMRLTTLKPFGGFCAETGGSLAIFTATALGVPVSTTHTITGAIVGVGTVSKPGSVRWRIASRIVWAWLLTLPASCAMAVLTYYLVRALGM